MRAQLGATQETGAVKYFVDMEKSRDNYVVDVDGNRMLDMFSHIASLPIGYNNPHMLAVFQNPANLTWLAHRPALFNLPPSFLHLSSDRVSTEVDTQALTELSINGMCARSPIKNNNT